MTLNEYPAEKNKNILNFAETHGCTACQYFKLTADYWCYMFKHQKPIGGCGQFKTSRFKKQGEIK